MGHHIDDEGRFKSDKYPDLKPDKVVIDLTDPGVWVGMLLVADAYKDVDAGFAEDLRARIEQLQRESMGANNLLGDEVSNDIESQVMCEHVWNVATQCCDLCDVTRASVEDGNPQRPQPPEAVSTAPG